MVLFQKKNAYDNNVKELEDLKSKQIEVVKNNQKVKAMQEAQYKELGMLKSRNKVGNFLIYFTTGIHGKIYEEYEGNTKRISSDSKV